LEDDGIILEWNKEKSSGVDEEESEEIDEDGEAEVHDDATLLRFISRLRNTQRIAEEKGREEKASRSRLKFYSGNSACTK